MNTRAARATYGYFDSRFRSGGGRGPSRTRFLFWAAGLVAIGLLCGFYTVVAGATLRAAGAREQLRVVAERQVVCSAFSTSSSRDLCLLTTTTRTPRNGIVQATYQDAQSPLRRSQLTAGL